MQETEQPIALLLEGMTEHHSFEYGVREWQLSPDSLVVSISAPSWDEYWQSIQGLQDINAYIVSPELITTAGVPLERVSSFQELVEQRVQSLCDLSQVAPTNTYILGTVTYQEDGERHNTALVIRAGRTIAQTHKRTGATRLESELFRFNALEPAFLVPNSTLGVLICADLATAAVFARPVYDLKRVLLGTRREHFVGTRPTLIHPDATSLIVVACWGVGGNRDFMRSIGPNHYYYIQMRNLAASVLRHFPKLQAIIVVDRLPMDPQIDNTVTPTYPLNMCITRS